MLDLLRHLWSYVTPGACLLTFIVLLLLAMLASLKPHEGSLPDPEDDPVMPHRKDPLRNPSANN